MSENRDIGTTLARLQEIIDLLEHPQCDECELQDYCELTGGNCKGVKENDIIRND